MYVWQNGSLGDAQPAPRALTASHAQADYCAANPSAPQCQPPSAVSTAASTVSAGWSAHWGILLGAVVAGFVVYKVIS